MLFERLTDNIYRLCVPFENIYTSVFAVESGGKWLLFDSGSNDCDANEIIIPAITKLGFSPDIIFISHGHDDHSGGLSALKSEYPQASVKMFCNGSCTDGETVLDCLKLLNLKGHSEDSGAVFDTRSKTLISGDSLQLYGVGRWGTGVQFPGLYLETVERLMRTDIDRIITSHDYYPLGFMAEGKMVKEYIIKCGECFREICGFVKQNHELDAEKTAELFDKTDTNRPPVPVWVINIIRKTNM